MKNEIEGAGNLKRTVYEMPEFIAAALDSEHLWDRYRARPPYQQNDCVGWITRAKRDETRLKRLNQMVAELRAGVSYMGMKYRAE